jgi:hypothetical protein
MQEFKVVKNKNSKKVERVNAFVAHLNKNQNENIFNLDTFCLNSPKEVENKNEFGISELKFLEISQFKNPTEFLNTSELSIVKEKNESKKTFSNELNNSYIESKLIELNRKMKETDFKGRPMKESSDVSSELRNDTPKNKNLKLFTFTSRNKIVEDNSVMKPQKLPSIDYLNKFEKNNYVSLHRKSKKCTAPKLNKIPKLKPLKTVENIRTNMVKHKKAIFLMTNQKDLGSSSVCSEEYDEEVAETNFFSDDEGILLSHDASDLNRKIKYQLNPFKNLKNMKSFYNKKLDIKHQNIALSQFTSFKRRKRSSVSTWKHLKPNKGMKFRDLAFVCDKTTKYLKFIQTDHTTLHLISKHSLKPYAEIHYRDIKMVILSEKDNFLMKLVLKSSEKTDDSGTQKEIVLEIPTRRKVVNVLHKVGLSHCILYRKSLQIEGDDFFKNYSFNLLPRSNKQGFLDLYVDDFFNDWKTFFVALVGKALFLFPVFRKSLYEDYKTCLRRVKIYRMISYNVVKTAKKIGLNERHSFVVKIKNENTQLIFNAFNKSEKKDWLRFL